MGVRNGFGLTAGAAVAVVLFDILPHLWPVEQAGVVVKDLGSSWVTAGGGIIMGIDD